MKVLVVEDDQSTAELLKGGLVSTNHIVEVTHDGADGSFLGRSYEYDVIILDYNLPRKDGLKICKEIRDSGKATPILFLTVIDDEETKVAALENGADDYLTKPFSLLELQARLKALVRRPKSIQSGLIKVGNLSLDPDTHSVTRGTRKIRLTRKEFNLLEYLMKNIGKVVSRASLLEHVWTADSNPFSNTIEAHIRNLRHKLNEGNAENMIGNIPGRGYVFDTPKNLAKL